MVLYVASRHLLSLAPVPLTCPYYSLDTLSVVQDVPGSSCIFPAPALAFPFLQGTLLPLGGEWYLETIVCAQVCSFVTGVTQVLCKGCASNHYTLLHLMLGNSPGSPLIEIPRLQAVNSAVRPQSTFITIGCIWGPIPGLVFPGPYLSSLLLFNRGYTIILTRPSSHPQRQPKICLKTLVGLAMAKGEIIKKTLRDLVSTM